MHSIQSRVAIAATILSLEMLLCHCGTPSAEQSNNLSSINADQTEVPFWPTQKPGDAQLSSSHSLFTHFQAAQAKQLPANYFRDLIAANAKIDIKYADWPSYKPGWFSGGTIYHPAAKTALSAWTSMDWSSFYNELFHAWWGNVFTKSAKYQNQRSQLLTEERKSFYRQANPNNPLLAQEEGYSETISTLMVYMRPLYNPAMPNQHGFMPLSEYKYNTGKTVSPVSHGDRPGFTPAAETTYLNPFEYSVIFTIFTDTQPPSY